MGYILTNGTLYLQKNCRGKYNKTSNINLAEIFYSENRAKNVLNNIKLRNRKGFYVADLDSLEKVALEVTPRKQTKRVEWKKPNAYLDKWKRAGDLNGIVSEAKQRRDEICCELSEIDSMLSDINHYIESRKFNAAHACKIEVALHKIYTKRRELKNEDTITKTIIDNLKDINFEIVNKAITKLETQKYKPRILSDLFETDDIDAVLQMI